MRVVVLADTHLRDDRRLPDAVYERLVAADVVLHAGDVVSDELRDGRIVRHAIVALPVPARRRGPATASGSVAAESRGGTWPIRARRSWSRRSHGTGTSSSRTC